MDLDLRGRDLLAETDLTPDEFTGVLDLAAALKSARRDGTEKRHLHGRAIALIFEKTSTRTRAAFEVAAYHQGAHVTVLDPASSQIGHKESVADTARVLARMYDAIEYRGADHVTVERLAEHADVPVYNGLTDRWHPTQMLADMLTMREHSPRPLAQSSFAYVGDARYNMGNSLLVTGAMLGMDVRIVAPAGLWPDEDIISTAHAIARDTGARLLLTEDLDEGVRSVDFVHTDVWVSMGELTEVWAGRIEALLPYQVNASLLARTDNPSVRFMHCLPAFHGRDTTVGESLYEQFGLAELEVTDEVFTSPASIVFDQAENRLHTIKALLVATLRD